MSDQPAYTGKSHFFLKGEAFIASLLSNGHSYDRLVLQRNGSFTKSYHTDIESVKPGADGHDNDVLRIKINRDGIYDRLPEGMFHQPRALGSASAAVGQMVTEYKRFREEEKAARRFFQPIEHELFRYATMVAQEEQEVLWGLLSGNLGNAFGRFWDLERGLPEKPSSVLIRIMPWAHLIKGNRELCAKALEMMLEKPVTIREQLVKEHHKDDDTFFLGDGTLGVDTVTGSRFEESALAWVCTIKEMKPEEVTGCVEDGPMGRFLRQFIDIFIPVEIDAIFEYEVAGDQQEITENILGYSFSL